MFARPPRMIIFGAVDFTAALAKLGKVLGYRVTVCDARPVFATAARFPMADEVVVDRPERYLQRVGAELSDRDAVCVLTHNSQFDVPAIAAAVLTKVGYIGAMGSRRTHADRVAHPRTSRRQAPSGRAGHGPYWPRHRRPDARGNGCCHLRRDHRAADGTARAVAARPKWADPLVARRNRRAPSASGPKPLWTVCSQQRKKPPKATLGLDDSKGTEGAVMELTNDFTVDVSVDEAWEVLTDLERIAPCMPGAELREVEGEDYHGVVKVKVGPITAEYKGKVTFVERDDGARRAVLRAQGREVRGQGHANAMITATLEPSRRLYPGLR